MFDFLSMIDNYDSRKVDRYEDDDPFVSTARVTDAAEPYETAVAHPQYHNNELVIVTVYSDRESAQDGHNKWVERMTSGDLPDELVDVSGASIAALKDALNGDDWRRYPRQDK